MQLYPHIVWFDAFFVSLAMRLPGALDSGGLGFDVTRVAGGTLAFLLSYVSREVWLGPACSNLLRGFCCWLAGGKVHFCHPVGPTVVGCRPQDGR